MITGVLNIKGEVQIHYVVLLLRYQVVLLFILILATLAPALEGTSRSDRCSTSTSNPCFTNNYILYTST